MALLKRNEQLNSLFNQFSRAIIDGKLDVDTAFYVVMGDFIGEDTLDAKYDRITDIFVMNYNESRWLGNIMFDLGVDASVHY
jgi:hypothetical protein